MFSVHLSCKKRPEKERPQFGGNKVSNVAMLSGTDLTITFFVCNFVLVHCSPEKRRLALKYVIDITVANYYQGCWV